MATSQYITVRLPGGAVPNYEVLYVGGINVIELINKAASASGNTSVQAGASVNVFIHQELFVTKNAGAGYAIGDILRRVEVINTVDGSSAVGWYNVTREVKLTIDPNGVDLRLEGDGGVTIEELRATTLPIVQDAASPGALAIGKVDDAISAEDGSGILSLVSGTKRMVASLFEMIKRTPVLGQAASANSSPVVLSTAQEALLQAGNDKAENQKTILEAIRDRLPALLKGAVGSQSLAVTVVNTADFGGGGGGGSTVVSLNPNEIETFTVAVAHGTDFVLGDVLRRVVVYNTTAIPSSYITYWFNATQNKSVGTPDLTKLKQSPPAVVSLDNVLGFRVIKLNEGSVNTVSAIETVVGGKPVSVLVYQETGSGLITGDGAVGWDIPAGGSYSLSESNGSSTFVLDSSIQFKSITGIMRLGVTYRKV